ncbi:MAG: winged helix-turn-helix domain-containing protein [Reyranella sp.]|uniref:winged helix-turn-helix domain-containing protein n=1 Tax=Reyranella sp. TaxID=1929291 RepID=UPI003D1373BA
MARQRSLLFKVGMRRESRNGQPGSSKVQFLFADHTLDTDRRELHRGADAIAVEPQVLDVLICLLQNRNRVVTKDDLIASVWGGRIVSEAALTSRIHAARKAIGDSGQDQKLIRTITRKGLRFVGDVRSQLHGLEPAVATDEPPLGESRGPSRAAPALPKRPERPAIAVLPFTNASGDPEQEYFSDGIAEDMITELSRSRTLLVIARTSSFAYKGEATSVEDIGRTLGVRYVLQGSTRKAGSRIRVTTRLVDVATGWHIWAEHFDRDVEDVFSVQDEITAMVCGAIEPAVERNERERAAHEAPERMGAWECYHRGMWHLANAEAGENTKARGFFARAIELDPRFARADSALALTYLNEVTLFRPDLRSANIPYAFEHAGNAIKNDATDATAHAVLARALWMTGSHAESLAEADLAVGLDPNSAAAHGAVGGARLWGGRPRDAIEPLQTAIRLSPFDPLIPLWLHFIARAHYCAEDYVASIRVARQLRHSFSTFRPPYNTLIAALGQTGQVDEARIVHADAMERFGERFRVLLSLPLSELRELRAEDREHLICGIRKAGFAA